jgi:S1-C subfamily serine protease
MRRGTVPHAVVLLIATAAFGAAEGTRANARRVAAQVGKSVVNLQIVSEDDGVRVSCARFSGVVLDKDLVLACCPDIRPTLDRVKGSLEVTYENLWSGKGFLTAVDEATGLCLVRCEGNPEPPPSVPLLADGVPKSGMRVLTVANPFGIERSVRYGTVRAPVFCGEDSSAHAYELLLPAVPGEEGGLVCGLNGNFLGMIRPVRGQSTAGGVAMAGGQWPQVTVLPGFAVSSIARHLREGRRVLRGWIRAKFTVARVGDMQRVTAAAVTPGGPADMGGLKPGDIILEANGKPITTLNDLAETGLWIEYEGVGKDLVLKVARQEDAGLTLKIAVGLKADDAKKDEDGKD